LIKIKNKDIIKIAYPVEENDRIKTIIMTTLLNLVCSSRLLSTNEHNEANAAGIKETTSPEGSGKMELIRKMFPAGWNVQKGKI
jgi:hypothetical protein